MKGTRGFLRQISQRIFMDGVDSSGRKGKNHYSQDEAIYAFMLSQHARLGQSSPAHDLPECCCVHIAEYAEDPREKVDNTKGDSHALIRLIANSGRKPGIQRAACDAITEWVFERPLSKVPTYQDYIDARNFCIREGDRRGLEIRHPLLLAGAVQVVSRLLEDGMRKQKLATVQSAAMALTTLTTDVERNGLVQNAVIQANSVQLCLDCIKFAVTVKDAHTIIYLVHPLGSLTYDDSGNVPESVQVRARIVTAGGVGPLVSALAGVHDHDGQYLIALLLGNLACDTQNKEVILRSGAVRAVLASMQLHANDQRVQDNSINLLRNLSVQHATALRMMYHQGAFDVLQGALRGHKVGQDYQDLARNLIERMDVYRREIEANQQFAQQQQQLVANAMTAGAEGADRMDIDVSNGVLVAGGEQ